MQVIIYRFDDEKLTSPFWFYFTRKNKMHPNVNHVSAKQWNSVDDRRSELKFTMQDRVQCTMGAGAGQASAIDSIRWLRLVLSRARAGKEGLITNKAKQARTKFSSVRGNA
jgi:hypothetical protein